MTKNKKKVLLAFSSTLLAGALSIGVTALPVNADGAQTYPGTLTLVDNGGGMVGGDLSSYHSVYNKTWVDVKDTEDLVIEYELIGSPLTYSNFGLVKGLQSATDYTKNIDAYFESIMAMDASNDQLHLGYLSSFVADTHIDQSSRSAAVKSYMKSNKSAYKAMPNSASIGGVYNIAFEMSSAQNWCYTFIASYYDGNLGANFCNYPHKAFATEGFAYRHIYAADGHYELWAKNATGFDMTVRPFNDWTKILTTDSTYGGALNTAAGFTIPNDVANEKIFANRSGYIGFVSNPKEGKTEIEIDNFKVSVTDGTNTTVKIDETYDCTKDNVYNTDSWGYTKTGVTTLNCDIPTGEEKVVTKYNDGTVTLLDWQANALVGAAQGGMYYKTPVTVADNEDLAIEYDYLADNGYYVGLMTGLQLNGTKVAHTAGSDIEMVMAMADNSATMLGAYDSTVSNKWMSSYGTDAVLQTYLGTKENRQHYYSNTTYSINFKTGSAGNSPVKSFRTVGYTYKHVFLASGGYECYAKAIGAADSEYSLILKTANTWAEDSYHGTNGCTSTAKIFANRSGYIGFIVNDGSYKNETITIDNFKVTVSGTTKTTVINDTYDRDYIGDTAINNWGYIAAGATTINYENDFTPAMAEDAGIRVQVGNMSRSGIRFRSNVDKDLIAFLEDSVAAGTVQSVEYGTIITAADLLTTVSDPTIATLTEGGVQYKNIVASGFNAECETETTKGFYASLVNIKAENYYREWIGRSYVKVTLKDGTEEYYYADYNAEDAISVYDVAKNLYGTEYYNGLSAEAQAVIKSYIDGVVVVTITEDNGTYTATYAGGIEGYVVPYTLTMNGGVLEISSTAYVKSLVVNGVQVAVEVDGSGKAATYTFRA